MRSVSVPVDTSWRMRWEMMSRRFTTPVDELWTVYCKCRTRKTGVGDSRLVDSGSIRVNDASENISHLVWFA